MQHPGKILRQLPGLAGHLKADVTIQDLERQARAQTDTSAAREMQAAKQLRQESETRFLLTPLSSTSCCGSWPVLQGTETAGGLGGFIPSAAPPPDPRARPYAPAGSLRVWQSRPRTARRRRMKFHQPDSTRTETSPESASPGRSA